VSTYKYTLFRNGEKLLHVLYEKTGKRTFTRTIRKGKRRKTKKISQTAFENSLKNLLDLQEFRSALGNQNVDALGFRYVHGGNIFRKPTKVNASVLKKLNSLDHLAPLHNPFARTLVKQSQRLLPKVKKGLFFDTAFHSTLPEKHWRYALPKKITDRNHIRRYGFHGLVCSSIVQQLKEKRKLVKKLIICHLGSGCSITAVKNGESLDTSMGFTPLEGIMMSTRAGDLDPGVLITLRKELKLSPQKMNDILNNESGLKALAGTRDMREILKMAKRNKADAKLALEMFCLKAAKGIAKAMVSLEGVDHIVFSGGIGENAPLVRQKICEYLKPIGIKIHSARNKNSEAAQHFQKRFSKIKLSWMHADEASEMNRELSFLF